MSLSKKKLLAIFTMAAVLTGCSLSEENKSRAKSSINTQDILEQLSAEDIQTLMEAQADGIISDSEKMELFSIYQKVNSSPKSSGGSSVSFGSSDSNAHTVLPDLMAWGEKALKENINPFAPDAADQSVEIGDVAKVEGASSTAYLAGLKDGVHVVLNKETGTTDVVFKDSSNSEYSEYARGGVSEAVGYYESGHGYAGKAGLAKDNLPNRDADTDNDDFAIWTISETDFAKDMVDGLTKVTIPAAELGGEDMSFLVMKDSEYAAGANIAGYLGVVPLANDGAEQVEEITFETLEEANYIRNMMEGVNVIKFKELGINVVAVKDEYGNRCVDTNNDGDGDTYDGGYHMFAMGLLPDELVPQGEPDMSNSKVALYSVDKGDVVKEFALNDHDKYDFTAIENLENGSFDFVYKANGKAVTFSMDKDTAGGVTKSDRYSNGFAAMSRKPGM